MPLSTNERGHLNAAVASVEATTGAQVVVACLPKSDDYPELPWLAFAFAAALTSLAVVANDLFNPYWVTSSSHLFAVLIVMVVGAGSALSAVFMPSFARAFLRRTRAEAEVRQQAQALFLEHELFATQERCGVLLLVSEFEHQVVVLPDKGVRAQVPEAVLQEVIDAMRGPLARGELLKAFELGLAVLEAALVTHGFKGGRRGIDELPNQVHGKSGALDEEKGEDG